MVAQRVPILTNVNFELQPNNWIHNTAAYQPQAFPAEEFCGNLPGTNTLTQLVFDYQDMKYRNIC